ncbi:DUF4124 domain-containing protein [Methylibium rhizosphaerae]|uniref:DUF4124 domain-containing protein n=1 Tax=Methylibium rhizosphaerae TaxID=2570323 RepID=UPI00112BAFE5|nr:DUF4124 domain-containing protein [Methylibium rhizosphaerae]
MRVGTVVFAALLLLSSGAACFAAPDSGAGSIYTCIDARGRKLTSDRPILECLDREQRVLNKDGSQRQTLPPSMTADERAAVEEAERRKAAERVARQDAIRRDRNLLNRFPNLAAHNRAREAALDDVRKAVKASEQRLAAIEAERKPLLNEAEFYKGKQLPAKLKTQLEFIDVTAEAQKTLVQNQQAEVVRITALYDQELERLKKLWAGAQPGSLGSAMAEALPGAGAAATRKP